MFFETIHHIAIICHDEQKARQFYVEILGFELFERHVRPDKGDIILNLRQGSLVLELFIKPTAPKRISGLPRGEASGLRHLAFKVADVKQVVAFLKTKGIECEPIRYDDFNGKAMTFFRDPDDLPIEIHE